MDTKASVEQCTRIIKAGGEMVRLTVRNRKEAVNLGNIRRMLENSGYDAPIVADVHFSPSIALEAARHAHKVRINPGNFTRNGDLSPFRELLETCKKHGTALRIGVNHGSLSERIMHEHGDTPEGMVESALEYLRICRSEEFGQVVVSLKSSNTRIMIQSNRQLARRLSEEGMDYPIHLGVTEAGEGEEGRLRSAVGIGTLLSDGVGDTLRVSITEAPENEIPVARKILEAAAGTEWMERRVREYAAETYTRRMSRKSVDIGGGRIPVVIGSLPSGSKSLCLPDYMFVNDHELLKELPSGVRFIINAGQWISGEYPPERFYPVFYLDEFLTAEKASEIMNFILVTGHEINTAIAELPGSGSPVCLVCMMDTFGPGAGADPEQLFSLDLPVILRATYRDMEEEMLSIRLAVDTGRYFIEGMADGLWVEDPFFDKEMLTDLTFQLLQSTRARMTRTEYIACPSCGRTLFDIRQRLDEIRKATSHLSKLKIAVMGCIVNGPGEMADADYGYVGAGPGKVSLYKGRECVFTGVPEEEALDRMIGLIRESGDWEDPEG